jgi:hypothetical protein
MAKPGPTFSDFLSDARRAIVIGLNWIWFLRYAFECIAIFAAAILVSGEARNAVKASHFLPAIGDCLVAIFLWIALGEIIVVGLRFYQNAKAPSVK